MVLPEKREKANGTEFWANVRVRKNGYAEMNVPPHVMRREELRSMSKRKHRLKFKIIEKEKE